MIMPSLQLARIEWELKWLLVELRLHELIDRIGT